MTAVPHHEPSCDYHDYYLKQVGLGSLPIYSEFRVQRGAGIGIILGRLWRAAVPIGQVRLGGSVRNYFSVRTILNSTGHCKLPR